MGHCVGGRVITAAVGLPALDYLIAPALTATSTDAWIPLGNWTASRSAPHSIHIYTQQGQRLGKNGQQLWRIRPAQSQTEVVAFSNVCTHLGCRVKLAGQ